MKGVESPSRELVRRLRSGLSMSSSNHRTRSTLRLRAVKPPAAESASNIATSSMATELGEVETLERELELWALRREKVLPLLAPRLARRARELATRCQILAAQGFVPSRGWAEPLQKRLEWLDIREQFIAIVRADSAGRSDIIDDPEDADAVPKDWEAWS